jgi:hypothetical protein
MPQLHHVSAHSRALALKPTPVVVIFQQQKTLEFVSGDCGYVIGEEDRLKPRESRIARFNNLPIHRRALECDGRCSQLPDYISCDAICHDFLPLQTAIGLGVAPL